MKLLDKRHGESNVLISKFLCNKKRIKHLNMLENCLATKYEGCIRFESQVSIINIPDTKKGISVLCMPSLFLPVQRYVPDTTPNTDKELSALSLSVKWKNN